MTPLQKSSLIRLLNDPDCKKISLVIAHSSPKEKENIDEAELNDFVLQQDGTLQLWHNTGYEI